MSQSYYQRNRDAVLARRKARRVSEPERYRAAGRLQMARWRAKNPRNSPHHGLAPAEIAARVERQGGCGICRTKAARRWHGDHDHATGRFRGVLCPKCNMGIGLLDDNPARLRAALAYLETHLSLQEIL